MKTLRSAIIAALVLVPSIAMTTETVRLEDLDLAQISQSFHQTRKDLS